MALFLPTRARDYVIAPLTFIPPGAGSLEEDGFGAGHFPRSATASMRRIYPSVRHFNFAGLAGEQPSRSPQPLPRPGAKVGPRDRVMSAPSGDRSLSVATQRVVQAQAGGATPAPPFRPPPIWGGAGIPVISERMSVAPTGPRVTGIPSPSPDAFPRRALSATAGVRVHAVQPPAFPQQAATATSSVVVIGGGLPGGPGHHHSRTLAAPPSSFLPPVHEIPQSAPQKAAPTIAVQVPVSPPSVASAPPARRIPPPFPALISLPLAVVQTLPGIDTALLSSFLRAETSAEMERARLQAEANQRALTSGAGALPLRPKAAAAVRRQRWKEGAPRVVQPPPGQAMFERLEVHTGSDGGDVSVLESTATPAGAHRRRKSLSEIHAAVLPALASVVARTVPLSPAMKGPRSGSGLSPIASPIGVAARQGHSYALSSEPVLAMTQLQQLGQPLHRPHLTTPQGPTLPKEEHPFDFTG